MSNTMYPTKVGGNDVAAWLNDFPGLAAITDTAWKEALAASNVVSFPAGWPLIECGDTSENLIIVLQGVTKVFQTAENGREICLYRVRSGQICILTLTMLLGAPCFGARAVAEEDVRLLAIPIDYFQRLMATSDGFRKYLVSSMASRLTEVMQLVAQVSFQRLDLRLACLIGQLSQQNSSSNLQLTHQSIANELGTTREVISRLLKEFENMGCIKLSRGRIEVLSKQALVEIASV